MSSIIKSGVLSFGRMNPPTLGHEKVIDKVLEVAKLSKASHRVVLSHSTDSKKNPLPIDVKLSFAKLAFPSVNLVAASKDKPTILHHMVDLFEEGVNSIYIITGSDRIETISNLIVKYNGISSKHGFYDFDKITVTSAGDRDPDSDDVSGVSGTKMREFVKLGDSESFMFNLPSKLSTQDKSSLYTVLREYMGIK